MSRRLLMSPAWRRYARVKCGIRGCAFIYLHTHEVEADFCHCGSYVDMHGWMDNHSPVPMIYPGTPHSWELAA
jgi:hypothetical protein